MTASTSASDPYFKDVLFILDGTPAPIDPNSRYVYNERGHTHHLLEPKGELIPVTPEDPSLSLGHPYSGITWTEKKMSEGTEWEYILTGESELGVRLLGRRREELPAHGDDPRR